MGAYMGDSAGADRFKENPEDSKLSKLTLFEVLWMSLLRRSIIEEYRLRFVEGITHHEDELFLTDFQNACSEVVEYPLNIYYYRRSSGTAASPSIASNAQCEVRATWFDENARSVPLLSTLATDAQFSALPFAQTRMPAKPEAVV